MRAALLIVLSGCLLGTRVPPLELRYFAPPDVESRVAATPSTSTLRVPRVTASSHLRFRIAHRESAVELQFYETLRWTERPDEYVRRALLAALEGHRVGLTLGGESPRLEVEVAAFEEVRRGDRVFGRVQLRYQLDDEDSVLATDSITVERAAVSGDISDVVDAIGGAMTEATSELAKRVAAVRALPPR